MRQLVLTVGVAVLVSVCASGFGQPPMIPPIPPASPPGMLPPSLPGVPPAIPMVPSAPVSPAGGVPVPRPGPENETPLAKFEPLSAFPVPTQLAVRSVLLGSNWLTRMNQVQGRFIYGYLPALRQPMEGDHDLRQAQAALALAQAARFTGDDRQAAVASQAILTLLAITKVDPAEPNCRVPVRSSMVCNRVGFAAVLALSIYELPGADEKLIAEAERLCGFIQKQLRSDGSIHYTDGPTDVPTQIDPAGVNEFPGLALHALAVGNRFKPAAWKSDALRKGLEHYRAWFKAHPHPMLAATLTPAFAELHPQTKSPEAVVAVFEMTDWLIALQYASTDPRHPTWVGGFRGWANGQPVDSAPGCECGAYLQSLACAYQLNRLTADLARNDRYRQAVLDTAQFLTGLQYIESNTRHFENTYRVNVLIGGFYLSPTDGNLRIDATASAVSGLLRFLACGAER